jgi:hypothetical protein
MTSNPASADWSALRSDWREIWAPGGRILVRRSPEGHVFDGSIVIECHDATFCYLVAEEGGSPHGLGVRVGNSAHSFGRFVPPIRPVHVFPEKLPLGALLGPLEKRIAAERDCVEIDSAAGTLVVRTDLRQPEAIALEFRWPGKEQLKPE